MLNVGGAKGFWKILKSISVAEIAREANRPLTIAVVGTEPDRTRASESLNRISSTDIEGAVVVSHALPDTPYIQFFSSTLAEDGFPQQPGVFDFVLDMGPRRESPEGEVIYSVSELGGWESAIERIAQDRPDLRLPLARCFPAFRRTVAQSIITDTSIANAQFALVTGAAEAIPFASWLLPVSGLSDIVVLTKNQTLMVLRLAAAYGLPVDLKSRMKEVGPILGNAFGWRAIARELTGAVPFVGFLVRASIAYAGTATVGKAAQYYYETGETLTAAQAKRLYQEAYQASREKIKSLVASARGSGPAKALPAGPGEISRKFQPEPAPLGLDMPPGDVEQKDTQES